jgi:Collagen triple helix repeat (20 copies)
MSSFRKHFGIPGVIAVFALVFAMAGGAWAAKKYVITSTNQIKPSVLKSLQGKAGPQGPAGSNGSAGAKGDAGPKGDNGAKGDTGTAGSAGTPGTAGKSIVTGTIAAGPECEKGGVSVEVEGSGVKKPVCNGKEGSPWTAGGVLPPEKTETGTWGVSRATAGTATTPIGFTLPLEQEPEMVFVQLTFGATAEELSTEEAELVFEDAAEHGCPGILNGVPQAEPGKLCVYGNYMLQIQSGGTPLTQVHYAEGQQLFSGTPTKPKPNGSGVAPGISLVGTSMKMICAAACEGIGVWAVTAEG